MINWIKNRISERTSWDGAMLIAVGVVSLLFQSLMGWAAWAAIIWGAWTVIKSE
jgi:hypothetical protein